MRLVVVGACYLDTILSVPHYPGEDEKLRATSLVRRRGGNGPNSLEVLSQLVSGTNSPLSLSLCSILPSRDSTAVDEIQRSLGPNVDLSTCINRPEYTEAASSYIIRSLETGSRTIVNYNELPEMTREEFMSKMERFKDEDCWFHFEGRIPDTTLACILHLREHHLKSKISVEVEKPGREGLQALANEADVVFYSKTWALHEGYSSARKSLVDQKDKAMQPTLLCCTWGERGASLFDRATGKLEEVPAYVPEGEEVKDSTGAGDTFIAGMLYCLLAHPEASSCEKLKFANKLAGCKVAQEGFSSLVARHKWLMDCIT